MHSISTDKDYDVVICKLAQVLFSMLNIICITNAYDRKVDYIRLACAIGRVTMIVFPASLLFEDMCENISPIKNFGK